MSLAVASDEKNASDDVLRVKADDFQGTMGEKVDLAGNVELVHDGLTVNADSISVIWSDEVIDHIEAEGSPVQLEQYDEADQLSFSAQAAIIKLRVSDRYLELQGGAELIQQGNKVTGESIRYDLRKRKLVAESSEDAEEQVEIIWRHSESEDESE